MKSTILILLFYFSDSALACQPTNENFPGKPNIVSMFALVSCAQTFSGEVILVKGILAVKKGRPTMLYLNSESRKFGVDENSILIKDGGEIPESANGQYVMIEGQFQRQKSGEVFPRIGNIEKMERWYKLPALH